MKLVLHTDAARTRLNAGAAAGLSAAGGLLLSAAQARCPVETGRLRDSGYARSDARAAEVGFATPYAAVVHERQNKFLEAPLNEPGLQAEILTALAGQITF